MKTWKNVLDKDMLDLELKLGGRRRSSGIDATVSRKLKLARQPQFC